MKIVVLSHPTINSCGVNNVVEEQVRVLRQNHDVVHLKLIYGKSQIKYGDLNFPKNTVLFNITRILFPFINIKRKKLTDRLKECDIIISHSFPMSMIGAQINKEHGIPHIYIHHGYCASILNPLWKMWVEVCKICDKHAFLHTSKVLSVSKYVQEQLKKQFCQESYVLYNGVDIDKFNPKNRDLEIKEKIGIREDAPFFFSVGNIMPAKGTEYIIKAFRQYKKIRPDAKLVIAGQIIDKTYFKKCKRLADESISFVGFLPSDLLLKFYATADVFVTGTLWEGFNLPLLEAQASGTPVVAFNHCSHPEVVKNKETGYLTKPLDISDMVKGFEEAYSNSEELSKNAREWAKKFSLETYAENLNMYIRQALEGGV